MTIHKHSTPPQPADGTSVNPTPPFATIPRAENFKNGSSKDMNVDGSVTAVDFDYTPLSGEIEYVTCVAFYINDPGSMDPSDFGSISTAPLTNGLQFLIKTDGGTETEITNMVDNDDIALRFKRSYAPGGSGEGGLGMLDEDDIWIGQMVFDPPLLLDQSQGDYLRFKVRDDITALDGLKATATTWRKQ